MSNESGIRQDYPVLVHGGDGTTLWNGLGVLSNTGEGVNTGAATITVGSVVSWDVTNLVMISPDAAASTVLPAQKRAVRMSNNTSYTLVAGVALNKAAVGDRVMFAGEGSVVPIRCVGTTAQYNLITSATDGLATAASGVAATSVGQVGKVVKIAGTTGGTTDSGSASYNIGLVHMY